MNIQYVPNCLHLCCYLTLFHLFQQIDIMTIYICDIYLLIGLVIQPKIPIKTADSPNEDKITQKC